MYGEMYRSDGETTVNVADHVQVVTSGACATQTLTTSAAKVKTGTTELSGRKTLQFENVSDATVYYGYDSSVTVANGIPVYSGDCSKEFVFDPETAVSIWAIAGGNKEIRVEATK